MSGTLFPQSFSVTRKTFARDSYGRTTIATTATISFLGSVQPMSGSQVSREFPGRESHGYVTIYSDTALLASKEGTSAKGDLLFWDGDYWEVVKSSTWSNGLIPHYEYAAENRGPTL